MPSVEVVTRTTTTLTLAVATACAPALDRLLTPRGPTVLFGAEVTGTTAVLDWLIHLPARP